MGRRWDALWRVVAFLWSIVAAFILSIAIIGAMIYGVVDVLWQLFLGSEGLSENGSLASWIKRLLMWPVDLEIYAFTGDGEMQWLP